MSCHFISLVANNVFHQYSETGFEAKHCMESGGSINLNCDHHSSGGGDSSDSDNESRENKNSPRLHRKMCSSSSQSKSSNQCNERNQITNLNDASDPSDDLAYVDTLPEEVKLVEVTSNLWGTKFKIHALPSSLPANLGQVTYKTSFLHLQPRQMTLVITELRDDLPLHLKLSKFLCYIFLEFSILNFAHSTPHKLNTIFCAFFVFQTMTSSRIRISIQMFFQKMKMS